MGAIFSNDISLFGEYKKQSNKLYNWTEYEQKKILIKKLHLVDSKTSALADTGENRFWSYLLLYMFGSL